MAPRSRAKTDTAPRKTFARLRSGGIRAFPGGAWVPAALAPALHRGRPEMDAIARHGRRARWSARSPARASPRPAWIAACAVLLGGAPARAAEWQFAADLLGGFMLRLPESLPVAGGSFRGDLRALPGGEAPLAGPVGYLGTRFDLGLAPDRHIVLRGLGVGVAGAVGPGPSVLAAFDGSIVEARPYRMWFVEGEILGLTVRGTRRRWAFEATASAGLLAARVPVAAQFGKDTVEQWLTATTTWMRVEGQACFRLDWSKRACLFVGVNVHQFAWWNGGYAGLRWEVGK